MLEFNDKGKFFTNVVTKIPVPCVIYLSAQKIIGKVHIRQDERLKDELDRDKKFLAVTDAQIYDLAGQLMYETDFIAVNKACISWVLPQQDIKSGDE